MEGRHCFGHLTIEENLLTGAFTRRDGRAAVMRDLEAVYAYFPRLKERRTLAGRLHLGRRAADVRDRPGDDVAPEAHPARRAVDGPRAAGGGGDFRDRARPRTSAKACRSCSPSRTPTSRCATRASAIFWRPAGSCSTARPRRFETNEDVREFYLGVAGREPALVQARQDLQAPQALAGVKSEDDDERRRPLRGACATGSANCMGGATRSPARSATSTSATCAGPPTSR